MKPSVLDHGWIALTIASAIYSQIVMKWRVSRLPSFHPNLGGVLEIGTKVFSDIWILSAFGTTFVSGVCWMVVLRKFELSYAFPFTALNFLVMSWIGITIFNERWDVWKISGTALVFVGILMIVAMSSKSE